MKKLDLLYVGKAKKVYATEDPNLCIFEYKNHYDEIKYH